MKRYLLIRHAETDMAGRFCGHSDPELNERGKGQLDDLVRRISEYPIARVYSSDLQRAQQTAAAIGHHFRLKVCLRRGLREIHFGLWEGLSWEEIEARDSAIARNWIESYPNFTAPLGEPFQDFRQRVGEEVRFLVDEEPECCVAVVTHAGFIRVVLIDLCGWSQAGAAERTSEFGAVSVVSEHLIIRSAI